MKNTNNKSSYFHSVLSAMIFFAFAFCLFANMIFAWFKVINNISDNTFETKELKPRLELQYWNKNDTGTNKWTNISTAAGSFFYPDLGEITDITELPADYACFKLKVNDVSGAKYKYDVYINNIEIKVYDSKSIQISGGDVPNINYYSVSPSQACFDYYYMTGTNNLDPKNIFYGEISLISTKLDAPDHSLSGKGFAASDEWMYIMFLPNSEKLQNIFKCVPTDYMPYTLEFVISISGESRTLDND